MTKQAGFSFLEVVVVLALGSLVLAATGTYSIPMLARETMRAAVYDVQLSMQLARVQAVSRNRDCRFVVDVPGGSLQVLDSMGTNNTADDELLYERALPRAVSFARPDPGVPVTLAAAGDGLYQAIFESGGTVSAGPGEVALFAGDLYGRISLFAAGGIQVQHWKGGAWVTGS